MYAVRSRSTLSLFRSTWGLLGGGSGGQPAAGGGGAGSAGDDILHVRLAAVLDAVAAKGYDGIEIPTTLVMRVGKARFRDMLERRRLGFIGMVFTSGGPALVPHSARLVSEDGGGASVVHPPEGRSAAAHAKVLSAQVRELCSPTTRHLLRGITSHTGRDYFSFEESHELLREAVLIERGEAGPSVSINHETHRGRLFHSPWESGRLLERHPEVGLCADLSHWQVLAEAPCADPELERAVALVLPRVRHVHARVGHEQGPQVPALTGPRWGPYTRSYMGWWERAMAHAGRSGLPRFTLTPEFGPAPYAWSAPTPAAAGAAGAAGASLLPAGLNIDAMNDQIAWECQRAWQARYGADTGGRVRQPASADGEVKAGHSTR